MGRKSQGMVPSHILLQSRDILLQLKHLNDQHQIQVDKINEIMTLLKQLENMINDQTVSINSCACSIRCYQLIAI